MDRIRYIDEFQVGDQFSYRREVTAEVVRQFADLSGDHNRIHIDEEYARGTFFGRRIAHGALLMAFFSKILGMDLPGPGAVYLSQTLEFLGPAYVGEEIEVSLRVDELDADKRILVLGGSVKNAQGEEIARGVSRVKLPKRRS